MNQTPEKRDLMRAVEDELLRELPEHSLFYNIIKHYRDKESEQSEQTQGIQDVRRDKAKDW